MCDIGTVLDTSLHYQLIKEVGEVSIGDHLLQQNLTSEESLTIAKRFEACIETSARLNKFQVRDPSTNVNEVSEFKNFSE